MTNLHALRQTALTAIVAVTSLGGSIALADTMVVTPTQTHGWTFAQEGTTPGGAAFVDGPATPPMGTGSANLTAALATEGPILFKAGYVGLRFDAINVLQYSTYRTSPAEPSPLAIALQLNVDADLNDANNSFQGRLVFEPYQDGSTVNTGEWETWNALNGKWWGTGSPSNPARPFAQLCPQSSPCTWAQVLVNWPDGGIHATLGAVIFKAGSGWADFDGNVDALIINNDAWDFNLHSTPTSKQECKDGGYANFNPPGGAYRNQGQCVSAANQP